MAPRLGFLVGALSFADLPHLEAMCEEDDPKLIDGCGDVSRRDLRAAIHQAMGVVAGGAAWTHLQGQGVTKVLLRMPPDDAARLAWEMVGGAPGDFVPGSGRFVAGPSGLAVWSGGWLADEDMEEGYRMQGRSCGWGEAWGRLAGAVKGGDQ